jgi:N-acetylglucosamine-6-phosphate deacetylase
VTIQHKWTHIEMTKSYFDALTGRRITTPGPDTWRVDDGCAPSYLVGPAFFDLQINGFAGVDFSSPNLTQEQLEHAVRALHRVGCSHFLLTLITADADFLAEQFRRIAEFLEASPLLRDSIPGFHLEGPFISSKMGYSGAHPPEHIRPPDFSLFQLWQRASGNRIRVVTLAPEWETSPRFIRDAAASGVLVSLGHCDATYDVLVDAVAAGARLFTHLGNGVPIETSRHDNIIQRVLAVPELMVSLIPDGTHLPPKMVSNLSRALGPSRLVMITDAISAAGMPPGTYALGELRVHVGEDHIVRHPDGKHLAGSGLTILEGFYNTVRFGGVSADWAWHAWTRMRTILFPYLRPPRLQVPLGLHPSESGA